MVVSAAAGTKRNSNPGAAIGFKAVQMAVNE